jgi:hypothetical protein
MDMVAYILGPSLPRGTALSDATPTLGSLGVVDSGSLNWGCPVTPAHHPHLSAGGSWKAAQSRRVHGVQT